jgi:hypothetical protein
VAEVDKGFGEMAGVYALAANMGLAAVRQIGEFDGLVWIEETMVPGR